MADTVNFKSAIFLLGSITILYHTIRNVLYHILPYRCQINQRSAQTIVAESKLSFIQPYSVALALVIWLYMCYKVQCQAIMYYKSQTACCDQNELTSSLTRCCFSFFSDTILSFFSGFGFFNLYFIQRSESLSVQEKKKKKTKHNVVEFKKGRSLNDEDLVTGIILSGKNYCPIIYILQSKLDHSLNSTVMFYNVIQDCGTEVRKMFILHLLPEHGG